MAFSQMIAIRSCPNIYNIYTVYIGQHSLVTAWFGFPEPIGVCHADELFYLWNFPNWNVTLNEVRILKCPK